MEHHGQRPDIIGVKRYEYVHQRPPGYRFQLDYNIFSPLFQAQKTPPQRTAFCTLYFLLRAGFDKLIVYGIKRRRIIDAYQINSFFAANYHIRKSVLAKNKSARKIVNIINCIFYNPPFNNCLFSSKCIIAPAISSIWVRIK